MILGGLNKFSLIDYPGKISCIVFTQGCNLKCPYCHNGQLITAIKKDLLKEEAFFEWLEKRKKQLDAVVITGGEPTIQSDLDMFALKIKEMGLLVKLDTNGTNPFVLEYLISNKLVDYIAMDVKATFEKYDAITDSKINTTDLKHSMEIISKSGIEHQFRTTYVKSFLSEDDIKKIKESLPLGSLLTLQDYRESYAWNKDKMNKLESNSNIKVHKLLDKNMSGVKSK